MVVYQGQVNMYYNFKKHLHKNSPKGGGSYLSWKKSPKHHQKSPIKKALKHYLANFWNKFYTLNSQQRIDLLKEASYQKYHYRFNYYKNRKPSHRMTNIPCRVCGKKPTLTHHIVLVKNGGINKKYNLIRLCELCHALIHEWLLDEIIQKEEALMLKEMNEFIDLDNT